MDLLSTHFILKLLISERGLDLGAAFAPGVARTIPNTEMERRRSVVSHSAHVALLSELAKPRVSTLHILHGAESNIY